MNDLVNKLFKELVEIPSPSKYEKEVANYILSKFKNSSIFSDFHFDQSGKKNDSNSGNLIIKGDYREGRKTIALVAHMDTVQLPGEIVKPVLKNGKWGSDGSTILGADNKASIASILAAILTCDHDELVNVWLVFTTCEESGLFGSSLLDAKIFENVDLIINVDGSDNVGVITDKAMGYLSFDMHFHGRASHSGKPELGINAATMMINLLAKHPAGKISEDTFLNYGVLSAGEIRNSVPETALVKAEIRSFSDQEMDLLFSNVKTTAEIESTKMLGKIEISNYQKFLPYVLDIDAEIESSLKNIYDKSNKKFETSSLRAISDVNNLVTMGKQVININRGGNNPHTNSEFILERELQSLTELIKQLLLDKNWI